jgi:hypothetical protein
MKKALTLIIGLGILLIFLTTPTYSQTYEICYPGNAFTPNSNNVDYSKDSEGYIFVAVSHQMNCTVNFPSSANGKQVTRISLSYLNNKSGGGNVGVTLYKLDRWSGTATEVGSLFSGFVDPSPNIKYLNSPKSMMTARGIDNNRYSWYLNGYSSGGSDLRIYQITIRYE